MVSNDVISTQTERSSNYGNYEDVTITISKIINILKESNIKKNKELSWPIGFDVTIFNLVNKLTRLANSPYHRDSALDLSSYSDLWLKIIDKESNNAD